MSISGEKRVTKDIPADMQPGFADLRRENKPKAYGRCSGCGTRTPQQGAGVLRCHLIERRHKEPERAVVSRYATTCPDCALKLWTLILVAFDEVGV